MNDRPEDARRTALELLNRIDTEGAYANVVTPRHLDSSKLSSRDRAFVTELVYGVTRHRRTLDHVVDRFLVNDPAPAGRAALRLGAYQLLFLDTPPHAAVSATVDATSKRFRGFVNAVLRKVAKLDASAITWPTEGTRLSYPDWIVERLQTDLGPDRALAALVTMNTAATVHRRDDGYIQDRSSQIIAESIPVEPGQLVLDMCAAPGGKATALAARGAQVVAADVRLGRVGLIANNRRELGADTIDVIAADGRTPPFRAEQFDVVVLDAPCSGLGSLRRRADARWRINPEDIGRLQALQIELLESAATLVKPGGRLVYSVCTMTEAETVGVASRLDAPFEPIAVDHEELIDWKGGGLVLPGDDTDGMAVFHWIRASDSS